MFPPFHDRDTSDADLIFGDRWRPKPERRRASLARLPPQSISLVPDSSSQNRSLDSKDWMD
jgi:hypothetical protein